MPRPIATIGHNSSTANQLRQIVERLERLDEDKRDLMDSIKDQLAEAKALGFDPKTIKKVLSIRKQDAAEREEQQAVLDVYLGALGMLPLFDGAEESEAA